MDRIKTLSRILTIREWDLNERKQAVRAANALLDGETARLNGLFDSLRQTEAALLEKTSGEIYNPLSLDIYYDYIDTLNRKIKLQIKVVEQSRFELQKRQEELVESNKEKRLVEVLRERLQKKTDLDESHREQKQMDFLWLSRS